VTASDVAFTYNFVIENDASAFIAFCDGIEQVEATDDLTAVFTCSRPKANLLFIDMPVLPEHIWGKLDPKEVTTSYPNDPPIVGSGPFQVVEWKHAKYLRMVAFDDFYLGRPTIDEIIYVSYQNAETMVQDLQSGALDCAYLVPPAQFENLGKDPDLEAIAYTWRNWDYIGLNCYTGESKGHPALRDPEFRRALEWAIDREALVQQAYAGYATPGWSFMPSGSWEDPDYHWEPGDDLRRDYDPEKAKELLDAAGYTDSDGDGVREYEGEPIKLRLFGSTRSPETQKSGKLIAAYWKDVGVDVALQVVDEAVYFDKIWNYEGDTFVPDFDAYVWQWDGYHDPGQTLDCFITDQIEGWNEMAWSNPTFDELDTQQNQTFDEEARADIIRQMQQVMYEDAAAIVTVFPYKLQVYRVDRWEGWQRALDGKGPAFLSATFPWSYMEVQPVGADEEAQSSTLWIALVAGAVVVGLLVVVVLWRRGSAKRVEE
jgi:peptide/nickel transport system substrate-binding protein